MLTYKNKKPLVVFDLFRGQLTKSVLQFLHHNNFVVTFVPANMTHLYQPLDLAVNGYANKFSKTKFKEWHANQTIQQLDEWKELYEIEVKFQLTMLKPLRTQWWSDLYNQMASAKGKNIVLKGCQLAGITKEIQKFLSNLSALNPFSDIFPKINLDTVEPNLKSVIDKDAEDLEMLRVQTIYYDDTNDDDDKEVYEIHSNVFYVFDDDIVGETKDL